MFFIIFFFKQKTAYEMRISDWSSDVCSSDLRQRVLSAEPDLALPGPAGGGTRRLHAANVRSRHQGGRQRWRRRRLTRNDHYHPRHANARARRTEERRVGKEVVSTSRSGVVPDHKKKTTH